MSQRCELENYDTRWDLVDRLEAFAAASAFEHRGSSGRENTFKSAANALRDLLIENNRLKYQVETASKVVDEVLGDLEAGRQRLARHIGDLTRERA